MNETSPTTTPNTEIVFLYTRPERIPELGPTVNLAIAMGSTASRAVNILRTRVSHEDGRPENVSEHSHMLAKVAPPLAAEMYPWLNTGLITEFSVVHDDPELWVGDTATDAKAKHDPILKAYREAKGVAQQDKEFSSISPYYVQILQRYEAQIEEEARYTRVVDKFMVLLIHLPNQGAELRANYTYEEMLANARHTEQLLLEQYPEWIELIEARTELSDFLARKYIRDWK